MLITSSARRSVRWVPVGRGLVGVLAFVLAALGAVRGNWASLVFVAAGLTAVAVAGATSRHARREGESVTVRAPLRPPRTVDVKRMAVRLERSGYGRASNLTIGVGRDEVAVPVAVFSPSSAGQISRCARRIADALDLPYDEEGWEPWLQGRTLDAPRPRRPDSVW